MKIEEITEADVCAWMKARITKAEQESGIELFGLSCHCQQHKSGTEVYFCVSDRNITVSSGYLPTIEQATSEIADALDEGKESE